MKQLLPQEVADNTKHWKSQETENFPSSTITILAHGQNQYHHLNVLLITPLPPSLPPIFQFSITSRAQTKANHLYTYFFYPPNHLHNLYWLLARWCVVCVCTTSPWSKPKQIGCGDLGCIISLNNTSCLISKYCT